MSEIRTLMDMGFERDRAEYALKATNNQGVEPAMEWLLAHGDDDIPNDDTKTTTVAVSDNANNAVLHEAAGDKVDDDSSSSSALNATLNTSNDGDTASGSSENAADGSPKSLKCSTCGRLCSSPVDAQFHASKTGHKDFEESVEERKPLTEEEKREQLAVIEEKLRIKRIEREKREKIDAIEREKHRIKSGKDMTEARKRMEELEMKKIVEQRRREKAEEKAARDRVRAQIAADKEARKAKLDGVSPLAESVTVSSTTTTTTAATTNAVGALAENKPAETKTYTHTRIQIRLQDGSTLMETFNIKEQLSAVRVFIQVKTNADLPFRLMTSFPRKVFEDEDYDKPLEALGLVPSAVLIMTKG